MLTANSPYRFEAPWEAFEFAYHVLEVRANLVVITMAWMTHEDARNYSRLSHEPDMETLIYWITRLEPVIRKESEDEIIVVFANRTGSEDETLYTGTSAVVGIKGGEVYVYGILGRGEKDLLVVDTELAPFAKLVHRPDGQYIRAYDGPALVTEPIGSRPRNGTQTDRPSQEEEEKTPTVKERSSPKKGTYDVSPQRPARSEMSRSSRQTLKKKLSIDTTAVTLHKDEREVGVVRTPTMPSPTPHSVRPRLSIQPADSRTMKFVRSQQEQTHSRARELYREPMSAPPRDVHVDLPRFATPQMRGSVQTTGGRVAHSKKWSTPSESTFMNSASHFTDAPSPLSDLIWAPPNNIPESWWDSLGLANAARLDSTNFSEGASYQSDDISPVVTHRAFPASKMSSAQSKPRLPTGLHSFSKSEVTRPTEAIKEAIEQPLEQGKVGRPASPKSRNASRSRGPERPGSAIDPDFDMSHIARKLDVIAQRVGSVQGRNNLNQQQQPFDVPTRPDEEVGTAAEDEWRTLMSPELANAVRPKGRLVDDGESRPNSLPNASAVRNKPSTDALVSRYQTHNRSRSNSDRGRFIERTASRTSFRHQQLSNTQHTRTVSRGRQPAYEGTPSRAGGQVTRKRSNPSQSVEPIDLSQFRLIEEYPSPNCPMHGRRPESSTRTHSAQGRQRMRSTGPPLGSPPGPRPQTSNAIASVVALPLRPIQYPYASSSEIVATDVGALPETTSTGSPSPNTPPEPQTPKAMALIFDSDNAPYPEPGLKCVERTEVVDISRPRSAIA